MVGNDFKRGTSENNTGICIVMHRKKNLQLSFGFSDEEETSFNESKEILEAVVQHHQIEESEEKERKVSSPMQQH